MGEQGRAGGAEAYRSAPGDAARHGQAGGGGEGAARQGHSRGRRISGLAEAGGCGRGHGETADGLAAPFSPESRGDLFREELDYNLSSAHRSVDPLYQEERQLVLASPGISDCRSQISNLGSAISKG